MKRIRKTIINYFLNKYSTQLWKLAGNIALRFHEEDNAAYDILQDKLYYWIASGIKEFV